jgi:hypothetical protein
VHGHGILHLQTSNQSPETFQLGILLVAAAIEFDAKGVILAFLHPVNPKYSSSSNKDESESNEPDYNEDKDQLAEEQEEETGETASTAAATTTNQVF